MANWDVIVLGGGPAGMTFGLWMKRQGISAVVVDSSHLGGQLHRIFNEITDYPGVIANNGTEMFTSMFHQFLEMGCAYRENVKVERVDVTNRLVITERQVLRGKHLVIATGVRDRRLGVPGEQDITQIDGYLSASRDSRRFSAQSVVVVGGGDRALEGALRLANAGAIVYLIHRRDKFRAKADYISLVLSHPSIIPVLTSTVTSIRIDGSARLVTVSDLTGTTKELIVSAVFLRIGVTPNSELVADQVDCNTDGYIIADSVGRTSADFVYAVGDVCTPAALSSIASACGQAARSAKWLATSGI